MLLGDFFDGEVELLQQLRGNATKNLLEGIRKSTREMIEEKEAVQGRLFTIEDVMQSNVRAWLQTIQHKNGERGSHFRCIFKSDDVRACIVTCGGLCPRLNTVIREIVCSLDHMYGVKDVWGIQGGYRGFYAKDTIPLTLKFVNNIHKRGGTIFGSSRGGHVTSKIVNNIQDHGINQVYIIGGDGRQKGASVIYEEIRRRGLEISVAAIPKTIDNDIPVSILQVIDKSLGFDTAVEEAQRAINVAHVEAESAENGSLGHCF